MNILPGKIHEMFTFLKNRAQQSYARGSQKKRPGAPTQSSDCVGRSLEHLPQ
jgi:hypothetical protein